MKLGSAFKIAAFSLFLATAARFGFLQYESWKEVRTTRNMCSAISNFLEVGSLREAFETLNSNLLKLENPHACVNIIDNGRSFAPDCLVEGQEYHATFCRAEANKGVRAEIRYPIQPLWSWSLAVLWLAIFLLVTVAISCLRMAMVHIVTRLSEEVRLKFVKPSPRPSGGMLSSLVESGMEYLGLQTLIREQSDSFDTRLKDFELRVREESALRARTETEVIKSKEYIEKVRQIRHDIKSPLSALFAMKEAVQGDPLVHDTLMKAIRRIQVMIEDLNNEDKEAKEPRLAVAEVLAEEVVAGLRKKFLDAKKVNLSVQYDKERLSPVLVVPDELQRILDNLLENAFEAVDVGGSISLAIGIDGPRCRIVVEDNGCGIAPENLARLFLKGATFGKVNGLGLGLFHAKRNLKSWGGDINCEPLAQGTRFVISVPMAQTGVTFVGMADFGPFAVIDDDISLIKNLALAGFKVSASANSYEDGQKLLAGAGRQNVVLVDQHLGNGRLGTDLIGESPDRARFLLCTNDYDNPEVVRRARHLGIPILPKPLCYLAEPVSAGTHLAAMQ